MLKSLLFTLAISMTVGLISALIFPWPFDTAVAIFGGFLCGWYHAEIYQLITGKSIY